MHATQSTFQVLLRISLRVIVVSKADRERVVRWSYGSTTITVCVGFNTMTFLCELLSGLLKLLSGSACYTLLYVTCFGYPAC